MYNTNPGGTKSSPPKYHYTRWSPQVVARQPSGERPAPAPCRTSPRCCACCTRPSSTRTEGWPAGLRLFPTLLSAKPQLLVHIRAGSDVHSHGGMYHLTFICSGSETDRRRFMNAFIAKTTSSPALLVSSCDQLPFVSSTSSAP